MRLKISRLQTVALPVRIENRAEAEYGRDQHLQSAETALTRLTSTQTEILTAYRGTPAPLINDRFKSKTGEAIGQLVQATLDMLGKLETGLGVQPLQLLFGHRPLGLLLGSGIAQALAPFDRAFESFVKIHGKKLVCQHWEFVHLSATTHFGLFDGLTRGRFKLLGRVATGDVSSSRHTD